jgi:hypothetical protein
MMGDSDPPAPDDAGTASSGSDSVPPGSPHAKDSRRRRLVEGVIPEIIKRAVELGVEKARESPDNLKHFVNDMKLPKEIASYLFSQIDETKNGLFRVVAKEIRDFLEHTNFSGEVQKLLTTVQFEVNTTIRFTPNDGRAEKKASDDEGGEGASEGSEEASGAEASGEGAGETRRTPLPKPQVKTQVRVHRDSRHRRSRPRTP